MDAALERTGAVGAKRRAVSPLLLPAALLKKPAEKPAIGDDASAGLVARGDKTEVDARTEVLSWSIERSPAAEVYLNQLVVEGGSEGAAEGWSDAGLDEAPFSTTASGELGRPSRKLEDPCFDSACCRGLLPHCGLREVCEPPRALLALGIVRRATGALVGG